MEFIVADQNGAVPIFVEQDALSGVQRIAHKVAEDIHLVTGQKPDITNKVEAKHIIFAATFGYSKLLGTLHNKQKIDIAQIQHKREVYLFQLVENPVEGVEQALVIAGSDKRGTIYGLFHLSELLGVSPWVYFADVMPVKQKVVRLNDSMNQLSKEPSVKYRGFFINDEWPAFGNWTNKIFNGFTTEMYEHVFELLLRLKGNYMWPAMWSSSFYLDGPGLKNAELADELGVIIGLSHHEPCLRNSEEWDLVRGENTRFGNAWNYAKNKEGLINYWREGLIRSGKFENVITIGMRGERDSSMLGPDATLKENIELLQEIIHEQRKLIKETIGGDLNDIPQMIALYKEVEAYFYGDEKTKGLKDFNELDGVIFMLCEDNFGNLRTLPTKEIRQHKGGFGMYYHFDYHGGPISYEWVNSTYLAKVWEQMTTAYEFGVQELWIVNVGDIKFQELPLSYFMDLAYDFERWGTKAPNMTDIYLDGWIRQQFGAAIEPNLLQQIKTVIKGYTKLNHNRKPEAMNAHIYKAGKEAETVLDTVNELEAICEKLLQYFKEENRNQFYELIYFPAAASLNVQKMNLCATLNQYYASKNRMDANDYANQITKCIERDHELTEQIHTLNHGKWYGMGMSEHIGFNNWNDEDCSYPLRTMVEPANKPRLIVSLIHEQETSSGGAWTKKKLTMREFLKPDVVTSYFDLANGSASIVDFQIVCEDSWIHFSKMEGFIESSERIKVEINKEKISKEVTGEFHVISKNADCDVTVVVKAEDIRKCLGKEEKNLFLESDGTIAMEAEHFYKKSDSSMGKFVCLNEYGKTLSAMKAFPQNIEFTPEGAPSLTYAFYCHEKGEYNIYLYLAPSNPVAIDHKLLYGIAVNNESLQINNAVSSSFRAGESGCIEWEQSVLNNIHICKLSAAFDAGRNELTFCPISPSIVLERIVIESSTREQDDSYLGPEENFYFE